VDINLLHMLIRQMAALVRSTLAEVCTVPLLLVYHILMTSKTPLLEAFEYCKVDAALHMD